MLFSGFCGLVKANELFNQPYLDYWIEDETMHGTMDDTFSMYIMGGEL